MANDPPQHLSARGAALWRSLSAEYDLTDACGAELLRRMCEASDVADEARAVLAVEGLTYRTKSGEPRAHPCVGIERDARLAVARLARELRVSEPPEDDRIPRIGRAS